MTLIFLYNNVIILTKKEALTMLIQFSAGNYTSIRDEITMSMVAGTGTEHSGRLISFGNEELIPSAAIFGANAAGKTNIQKAMTAAILFVRNSNQLQINMPIPLIIPFGFDKTHPKEPCWFDFIFTVGNTKYQYGFATDTNKVYEEYLYRYTSSRGSMIFKRTNTDEYRFTKANESELKKYQKYNTDNKLFLSTATNWNCELTKEAFMWFAEGIDTFNGTNLQQSGLADYDSMGEVIKPFTKKLLENADINITDYSIESQEIPVSNIPAGLFPPGLEIPTDAKVFSKEYKIFTQHRVKNENGEEVYSLPINEDSEGTRRLFFFSPAIMKALEKGRVIVVDEMDSSFHPLLLDYLIDLFNNKETNKNGAQLIFNTHSLNNLSLEKFRRDQIYFVEKNGAGATELFSLDDFSTRKTEDVRKRYLQGRYGAIPNIGLGDLL